MRKFFPSSIIFPLLLLTVNIFVRNAIGNFDEITFIPHPNAEITFTVVKDNYAKFLATKLYHFSREKKLQFYFEVLLTVKKRENPVKIGFFGVVEHNEFMKDNVEYITRMDIAVGERLGCGVVNLNGKFFYFFTKNERIFPVENITKLVDLHRKGVLPFFELHGHGTQISMSKKYSPPSIEEIEQKIAEFEQTQLTQRANSGFVNVKRVNPNPFYPGMEFQMMIQAATQDHPGYNIAIQDGGTGDIWSPIYTYPSQNIKTKGIEINGDIVSIGLPGMGSIK